MGHKIPALDRTTAPRCLIGLAYLPLDYAAGGSGYATRAGEWWVSWSHRTRTRWTRAESERVPAGDIPRLWATLRHAARWHQRAYLV